MQTEEKKILLATLVAATLASGCDEQEIKELLTLLHQISCSLSNMLNCKHF